jgi:hypothetical protein
LPVGKQVNDKTGYRKIHSKVFPFPEIAHSLQDKANFAENSALNENIDAP